MNPSTQNFRIAIVAGTVHSDITEAMVATAKKLIEDSGASIPVTELLPGSYEVVPVVKELLQRDDIDAIVVLGAIERGETNHGLVMGHVVHQSIMNLQLEYGKPIGFGIIGPGATPKQMHERKVKAAQNAARAALVMAGRRQAIDKTP